MSAIAGVLALDGAPAHRDRLHAISCPAIGSTVDDLRRWSDGPVGLSCALTRVAPEDHSATQPLVDLASGCAVVFEGRVDNRAELRAELAGLSVTDPDAAYALAAYRRWGDDAPGHLLGDFALAVWNPSVRTLLLARDPVGIPALYYTLDDRGFAFASTLEQLLADPSVSKEVDPETIAWFLYDSRSPTAGRSFYRHIRIVPAGHTLSIGVGARSTVQRRYWHWPETPPERAIATDDDAEQLRQLLTDAVRGRLRSTEPVAVLLSGGLDSSAVACLAGSLRCEDAAPVHAYTATFERFSATDERRFAAACAERWGFRHTLMPADTWTTLSAFECWRPVFTEPFIGTHDEVHYATFARAREDGCRAVMTGNGGDHLFSGSPQNLAALLMKGEVDAVHREARARGRGRRTGYLRSLAAGVILPLLPAPLQRGLLRRTGRRPALAASWMPPSLKDRFGDTEYPRIHRGPNSWWYAWRDALASVGQSAGSHQNREARRFGLELRAPLVDVRLIDFVLRLPVNALYRHGRMKAILRTALEPLWPAAVGNRTDKADFSALSSDGLRGARRSFVEQLLVESEVVRQGYVRAEPWTIAVRRYLDHQNEPLYWVLWRSLTLEMWLRAREGRLPTLA